MKYLFAILSFALVLALPARAQTDTNLPPAFTNAPTGNVWSDIWGTVKESGLLNATNYAFEPYLTYAPDVARKKDRVGGGALAIYNVNQNVGVGLGVDYLGRFSLVSANITLKLPVQPFSRLASSGFFHDLTLTPFVLGGFGKPLGGTTSDVATIADVGAALSFGHLWGGQFNVGGCYGSWINAGDYSGKRYHIFLGWSAKF